MFGVYESLLIVVILPIFYLLWKLKAVKVVPVERPSSVVKAVQSWSLYAIRAPGDEASMVINASQFLDWVSNFLFLRLIIKPYDWAAARLKAETWPKRIRLWLALIPLLLLLNSPLLFHLLASRNSAFADNDLSGAIMVYLCFTLFSLPFFALTFTIWAFTLIALIGPLALLPAHWVLALAVGRDIIGHYGLLEVECEPIPSGITGIVSTISISDEEQSGLGLMHFIHATDAARARVGQILRAPAAVHPLPV